MPQAPRALVESVEQKVRHIFLEGLGYEVDSVTCRLLGKQDFIVSIERSLSATERLLIKEKQPEIALEIGLLINAILKDRLFLALLSDFSMDIAEISILQPTKPEKLNLAILTDTAAKAAR